MPYPSRPRAPADACGRSDSTATGAMPRCSRIVLTACARSPAESASVPSRSNSTTETASRCALGAIAARAPERSEIVDRGVAVETIAPRQRVVDEARHLDRIEAGAPRMGG